MSRNTRSNNSSSNSRGRKTEAKEEDVTLDDLIRDKAIRPGDELCLVLEYTKSTGEKVSFREVGHMTADGWINDEHNNTHSALDQWAYATVGKTKKLTAGQRTRLISTSNLWKQVTVNNDTLDNIRKCYVEWILSNKENNHNKKIIEEEEEEEEKKNENDDKIEIEVEEDENENESVGIEVENENENVIIKSESEDNVKLEEEEDEDEDKKDIDTIHESNGVDLNADTLPALRTPPPSPPQQPQKLLPPPTTTSGTSETPTKKTKPKKSQTPTNFKTPDCKRKDFFRSPCLDTEKKKPRLLNHNNTNTSINDNTATNDDDSILSTFNTNNNEINEEFNRYEHILETITARESTNTSTSTQLSHIPENNNNNNNNNNAPIVILPTSLRPELLSYLRATAGKIGGTVATEFSPSVTHIITETDDSGRVLQRTLKYAQGVLAGLWIVSFPWVLESMRRGSWAPEDPFAVAGDCFSGERGVRGAGCRDLFGGKEVYFSDAVAEAMARELAAVVRFGGGAVLEELPGAEELTAEKIVHPSVVVVAPSTLDEKRGTELYLRCGRRPVSYKWIMDSVSGRALADIGEYEIASESAITNEPSLVY